MKSYLIQGAKVVNEGSIAELDVLIKDGFIVKVGKGLSEESADETINASGKYLYS